MVGSRTHTFLCAHVDVWRAVCGAGFALAVFLVRKRYTSAYDYDHSVFDNGVHIMHKDTESQTPVPGAVELTGGELPSEDSPLLP